MPAVAGNHPGHQPGTTQARHFTGQGQLPCAHKGPNFVSVMRLQLTAGAARRNQTPVSLWRAAIRLNATASDKTARNCQEKGRFGRCPSPLPREWLRFPGCGGSRLMKFAPDGSRGSSWPSPAGGDPAGPVPQYRGGPSRTGIRGDELRAAVSRWSKCGLTARCARVGAGTGAGRCVRRRTSCICTCRGSRTMFGRLRVCPRPRGGARRSRRHR